MKSFVGSVCYLEEVGDIKAPLLHGSSDQNRLLTGVYPGNDGTGGGADLSWRHLIFSRVNSISQRSLFYVHDEYMIN